MSNKTKWVIDKAHTELAFKVKHMMITNVKGIFNEYDGDIHTLDDDFNTVEIDLHMNTSSINTNNTDRDNHLKSKDFFDVESFKDIKFKSKSLTKKKDNVFELTGDLTIKNITKIVRFDAEFGGIVKDPWGNTKAGFTIDGKINRKDWDLSWNGMLETGGVLIGEEVRIMCEAELMKAVQ